jgi:hypothetical protein
MSGKMLSYADLKKLPDAELQALTREVEQQPEHDASWNLRMTILRNEQRRRGLPK